VNLEGKWQKSGEIRIIPGMESAKHTGKSLTNRLTEMVGLRKGWCG
jgi:hypothetical protein